MKFVKSFASHTLVAIGCVSSISVTNVSLAALLTLLLAACGGGGGGGSNTPAPTPTTGGSGGQSTDGTNPPSTLARPNLVNASAASLTVGSRATITFTNSGGGSLTSCRVNTALPPGLTVSRTSGNRSCQITGTPSTARNLASYRVTATNATGSDTTAATVSITVRARPVVPTTPTTTATVGSVMPNSASISVTSNTSGTAYIVYLPAGEAAPNAAAIKRARAGSNGVAAANSMVVTAGSTANISQTGLTAGKSYSVYVVVESSTGTFSAVMKIDLATTPLAVPDLDNAPATNLTFGVQNPISFVNNGGGALTSCTVEPDLPEGLAVAPTADMTSCEITSTPTETVNQTTYTIIAINATGADATPATISITVNKANQSGFDAGDDRVAAIGNAPFTQASIGGESAGSVSYASSNPSVATVVASTGLVTIVGSGVTTIRATKAGDNNYNEVSDMYILTVNIPAKMTQANFEFAVAVRAETYSPTGTYTLAARGGSGSGAITYDSSETDVATVADGGVVTIVGAGIATITAIKDGDATYNPSTAASYKLTVAKADQAALSFPITTHSVTYGGSAFTRAATGGAGTSPTTYDSSNTNVATIDANGLATIVGAGMTTITADRAGDANYEAANQAMYTLTVNKADQTGFSFVDGPSHNITIGAAPFTREASGGQGTGAIAYKSSMTSVATVVAGTGEVTIVGTGETVITATKAESDNHNEAEAMYTLTVTAQSPVDVDNNGLIEIGSLAELNNVRYNLSGTSYIAGPGATPNTTGCPDEGCRGYELTADLDFDDDKDGSTWMRNNDGSYTLDADDNHPDYFDTADGGWLPIGDGRERCADRLFNFNCPIDQFTGVFDGQGHTISNLATTRDLRYIGLFGVIGTGADIRNICLNNNLSKLSGPSATILVVNRRIDPTSGGGMIGGLVGRMVGGSITNSCATGRAEGYTGDGTRSGSANGQPFVFVDRVGGLVGYQAGGVISSSYATGIFGAGKDDTTEGIVGRQVSGRVSNSSSLNIASTQSTRVGIGITSSSDGTAYIAILADDATPPTAAAIKAATSGTEGVISASSSSVGASEQAIIKLARLMPITSYDAYIVIEYSGGTASAVTKIDLTTTLLERPNLFYATPAMMHTLIVGGDPDAPDANTNIEFTNEGGGLLTGCGVTPPLPDGLMLTRTDGYDSCHITGTPTAASDQVDYTITASNMTGSDETPIEVSITVIRRADADGNGLIEIFTLTELNNIRNNLAGTSYYSSTTMPHSIGCPESGCFGYELMNDLSFDKDGDGSTWIRNGDGSYTLDADDHHPHYFDTESGGWVPIGDIDNRSWFSAVFNGRGHTITGLATVSDESRVGMFGIIISGTEIRNLGLVGNLSVHFATDFASVGGLVGSMNGGAIVASYSTGHVDRNSTKGNSASVGGLVGYMGGGAIVASYATGNVSYRSDDSSFTEVGGLVGNMYGGSITASYATGDVVSTDESDSFKYVGGLVGSQNENGSITASYATGKVSGSSRVGGLVGGLVGWQEGSIVASFSVSEVDGGNHNVGRLVGLEFGNSVTTRASWGFGRSSREGSGNDGSDDLPNGVTSAMELTIANVPPIWHSDNENTLGAWDFGTSTQVPALRFSDYDGEGTGFHCESDGTNPPDDAIIIPNCGSLIPSINVSNVLATTADINVISNIDGTAYVSVLTNGSMAPTATQIKSASLGSGGVVASSSMMIVSSRATVSLADLMDDTMYDVFMVVESGTGSFGRVMKVGVNTLRIADADGNGLIEINSLVDLHNVRYNLNGTGYQNGAAAAPSIYGCPETGCLGYELTTNLDFDADKDGSTWSGNSEDGFTLDSEDNHPDYFDTDNGGWIPIGDASNRFTAVFDGQGHTISGLATAHNRYTHIGLFGSIGTGADIRNLGLVGNLAKHNGSSFAYIGGLVGQMVDGSITATYTTGDTEGGSGRDDVGGLVGQMRGGSIVATYTTGEVVGDGGSNDDVGGVVGEQTGGAITASYATGNAHGGPGNSDNVGGLVGRKTAGSITASYANGDVEGDEGSSDYAGKLVGHQPSYGTGTITASWGFGTASGENDGIDGSQTSDVSDLPTGVTSATGLTSANVPDSWRQAASSTLGAWDFGTTAQLPAISYADYDGSTVGTAPNYTSGHNFHCASDIANAPEGAIIIPNCGMLIPGQTRTVSSSDSLANKIAGSGGVHFSLAVPASVQMDWIGANNNFARAESVSTSHHLTTVQWGSNRIYGGMGIINTNNIGDVGVGEAWSPRISITLQDDASANLIATFDDTTDDLEGMRADAARYSLTGIFADPSLDNWNNFDRQPDSARVGRASVSTWEIGTMVEAQATGSIIIKNVKISEPFINFLMAGGGVDAISGTSTGRNVNDSADVGVEIQALGTDNNLVSHSPNSCSDKYLKGEHHWVHFDVSSLVGLAVDIVIYDRDAINNCGFIAFDHFYQSSNSQGRLVGSANLPTVR